MSWPKKNSSQVAESGTKTNGTEIIYTVPSGKVFYLCTWTLSLTGTGTDEVHLKVRNASDVDQYTIQDIGAETTLLESQSDGGTFNPPLAIPAGYDVILVSGAANADGAAFIHGFTEDL